jgi:glycosyltransferase involved in cell wall biosynthesis
MIAYHFPPLAGSSGIQRTLRFVQHLPQLGWRPVVLTAHPRAYPGTSDDLTTEIPADVPVYRAFALDTARHLSFAGRYFAATARPDRWVSWRFDAVRQGMRLIRQFKPRAIWSTYPIATAHLIGAALHRRSGLPWVADFRDPMAQNNYPADKRTWRQYRQIEEEALLNAAASTFTTPSAAAEYSRRYPGASERVHLLENGYDEESFTSAEAASTRRPLNPGAVTLLHSGIVYPSERDPTQLMVALRQLIDGGVIRPGRLKVRFRAPVADELLRSLAARHDVEGCVEILPPLPYREALTEMLDADGLLVLQASNCNAQVPAKLYEYLRARRPILCLTDPVGDTAAVLRDAGIDSIARLDDAKDIADLLQSFLALAESGAARLPRPDAVLRASRRERSRALATVLDRVSR